MKLLDYARLTNADDIMAALKRMYPHLEQGTIEAHIVVLSKLLDIEPIATDMYIVASYIEPDEFNPDGYWAASGKYPEGHKENEEWDGLYCLGFVPWGEIINMQIVEESPDTHGCLVSAEILALVLYEITFYGYNEGDIQAELDKLVALTDDPNLEDSISHEDFLKSLDEEE